jgi:uncharacterized protein YeeX (DUF496 family)
LHQGKDFFIEKNKEILNEIKQKSKVLSESQEKKNVDPMKEILNKISNFYQFIKNNIVNFEISEILQSFQVDIEFRTIEYRLTSLFLCGRKAL